MAREVFFGLRPGERGICRVQATSRDPIRPAMNGLGLATSSANRGGVRRCGKSLCSCSLGGEYWTETLQRRKPRK